MSETLQPIKSPELVFGIAGPIGVDMDTITQSLLHALGSVSYRSKIVKLTTEMRGYNPMPAAPGQSYYDDMIAKMDQGNRLCRKFHDPAVLAHIAIRSIRAIRQSITSDVSKPAPQTAYIIRQLKRPAEVDFLRKVYGRQFIRFFAVSRG